MRVCTRRTAVAGGPVPTPGWAELPWDPGGGGGTAETPIGNGTVQGPNVGGSLLLPWPSGGMSTSVGP